MKCHLAVTPVEGYRENKLKEWDKAFLHEEMASVQL